MVGWLAIQQLANVHGEPGEILQRVAQVKVEIGKVRGVLPTRVATTIWSDGLPSARKLHRFFSLKHPAVAASYTGSALRSSSSIFEVGGPSGYTLSCDSERLRTRV